MDLSPSPVRELGELVPYAPAEMSSKYSATITVNGVDGVDGSQAPLLDGMHQTSGQYPHLDPFKPSFSERLGIRFFHLINKFIPWFKLPGLIGAFNLAFLRLELRQFNLYDGYANTEAQGTSNSTPLPDERYRHARHSDGEFNSLEMPLMGCQGMRFGRNFPRIFTPKPTEEELWTPNPRIISDKFMARRDGRFIPATSLNMLAAAWIQFQIHDWFNHPAVSSSLRSVTPT
jgi:hypothetical protein